MPKATEDWKVERILMLLKHPDITMDAIARRMGCTPMTVTNINRQHKVRKPHAKE